MSPFHIKGACYNFSKTVCVAWVITLEHWSCYYIQQEWSEHPHCDTTVFGHQEMLRWKAWVLWTMRRELHPGQGREECGIETSSCCSKWHTIENSSAVIFNFFTSCFWTTFGCFLCQWRGEASHHVLSVCLAIRYDVRCNSGTRVKGALYCFRNPCVSLKSFPWDMENKLGQKDFTVWILNQVNSISNECI